MGGASGIQPKAHLLIADEDQSLVSSLVATAFQQGPMTNVIEVELVTREQGDEQINAGGASGLLIIPAGFGEAVIKREETTLTLLKNPSQQILPAILEESTQLLADAVFYLQEILGDELALIESALPTFGGDPAVFTNLQVADSSVALNEKISKISQFLFPPILQLVTISEEIDENEPAFNFTILFFSGILTDGAGIYSAGDGRRILEGTRFEHTQSIGRNASTTCFICRREADLLGHYYGWYQLAVARNRLSLSRHRHL